MNNSLVFATFLAMSLITSCRAVNRAPANEPTSMPPVYTADFVEVVPQGAPVKGSHINVAMNENDVGKCVMSIYPGNVPGLFHCTLKAEWSTGATLQTKLVSPETNHFVAFDDKKSGEQISVQLLADRLEVSIRAESQYRAESLVSNQLRANLDKLRMVRYAVTGP